MTPEEYQTAAFDQVVKIGKATSNITRLKILYYLSQGRKSVEELAKAINISVGTTSKNLQLLKRINLVKEDKDKNFVFYTLKSNKVAQLVSLLIDLSEENLKQLQELNEDYNDLPSMNITQLRKRIATTEPYIVDLRPEDEFKQGHLPYAHNLPYNDAEFSEKVAQLPKSKEIVLYCRGRLCGYSEKIGKELIKLGYQVITFNNSVKEWQLAE